MQATTVPLHANLHSESRAGWGPRFAQDDNLSGGGFAATEYSHFCFAEMGQPAGEGIVCAVRLWLGDQFGCGSLGTWCFLTLAWRGALAAGVVAGGFLQQAGDPLHFEFDGVAGDAPFVFDHGRITP